MDNFKKQTDQALKLIDKAKRVIIVPSTPVDGDTIGSSLALMLILQKMGKSAEINYSFDRLSAFKFLPGAWEIKVLDLFKIDFSQYDLAVFPDGGDLSQFYDNKIHREEFVLPKIPVINIDHHPTNSHWTEKLVYKFDVSSTGEMVYLMFKDEVEFDKDIATNLYTAISTDSGHFRYTNTSKKTLEVAGELLDFGIDLGNLVVQLYQTDDYESVKFSGYLTTKIEINNDLHYCWFKVSYDEWQKEGLTMEELKNAVSRTRDGNLRAVDGTDFVFCLIEEQSGFVNGSWRSRNPGKFDLSKLAKLLGGGGHKEAAGFNIRDKTLAEAEKIVHQLIKDHYSDVKIS